GGVAPNAQRQITLGIELTGNHREVPASRHVDIAASANVRPELLDAAGQIMTPAGDLVAAFGRQDKHVPSRVDLYITPAVQHATDAGYVAPGTHAQAPGRLDPRSTIDKVLRQMPPGGRSILVTTDTALVNDVARQSDRTDVAPSDDAAPCVENAVRGQQGQPLTGLHQAGIGDSFGCYVEVAAGAQGTLVIEFTAGDQRNVAALNQRAVGCQA